jgi:iron-sulfur cluster repair protein YtfE (RIC family)
MRFTRISNNHASDASAPPGPMEMLSGCHSRIRHFMQLSRTLADAKSVTDKTVEEAAGAIFRYFTHALPLHEADENDTLFPRLRDALPHGNLVREAAETMVEQHKAIDELAAELLTICAALSRQPEHLPSVAGHLNDITRALDQIFTAHLHLEESVVFPAVPELLNPAQLEEMYREMHQRRRPSLDTIHLVQ